MEHISPTRTELLTRRAQIRLAEQGAKLLRGKRAALVREFLREIRLFKSNREEMLSSLSRAALSLMQAIQLDGPQALRSLGLAAGREADVELVEQNIWGTRVVDADAGAHVRKIEDRRCWPPGVSARMDETMEGFEQAVENIIRTAPKFHKLGRLAEEIRSTSRRVNALEQRLLPALTEQVGYIRGVLNQREREDTFRLKRIKQKRAVQARGRPTCIFPSSSSPT